MCVLTTTLAATATAALAASLTSAIGATAATITSGIVVGAGLAAIDGAIMGAAGSAISGGDVGDGAVNGLWMGAATGAVGGGLVQGLSEAGLYTSQASAEAHSVETSNQILANSSQTTNMFTTGEQVLDQGHEAAQLMKEAVLAGNVTPAVEVTDGAAVTAKGGAEAAKTGSEAAKTTGNGSSGEDIAKGAVGAGMQIASGAVEAYGYREEAKENADILKAQAKNAEIQAQQQIDAAEIEARDLARRQRQNIGKGKVAAAANGVLLEGRAESSPAIWEQDMQAEGAWDREKLMYNANIKANALRNQASIYRQQAANVRSSGNLKSTSALIKGVAGAGLSLFGNSATTLFG